MDDPTPNDTDTAAHEVVRIPVESAEVQLFDMRPLWKARSVTEGDRRFVYCEPANESVDGERDQFQLQAIRKSWDLYRRVGNIDIEHLSLIGQRQGIANPREWEIGRPVDLAERDGRLFLKGEIYRGAERAEWFWKTQSYEPAMPWYPSIGCLSKPEDMKLVFDRDSGTHKRVVVGTQWINTGFARQPINLSLPAVTTTPIAVFAKAVALALAAPVCEGGDCTCLAKAAGPLTAGAGTDAAILTGGGALQRQSIHGCIATAWKGPATRFLRTLGTDRCAHTRGAGLTRDGLIAHFTECEGMPAADAQAAARELLTTVRELRRSGERFAAAA